MSEVSVVIPSYNHAAFIERAVQSVLNQTLSDLELIVVDDGSRDNSLEVLAGLHDPRLRVIAQENRGAHAAINRGLQEARGGYLAILNSDDEYTPQRLEKLAAVLKADPQVGLAGSYIDVVDVNSQTLGIKHGYKDLEPWLLAEPGRSFRAGDDLHGALLTENYWSTTSNYVFGRSVYADVGAFRPLRYAHDWDFVLRIAEKARLALLPEPLMRYRIHGSNTIRENRAAMLFEICWILAVHLPRHMDSAWYGEQPPERRVDQLLHSVYVHDLDKVLAVMLAHDLAHAPEAALQLLQPENPQRQQYLEYITSQLARSPEQASAAQPAPADAPAWRRQFGRVKRALLRRLGKAV